MSSEWTMADESDLWWCEGDAGSVGGTLTSGGSGGSARFNPPPGWPTPPDGWTPEPGWRPDPGWPPAPSGWALWVDDLGEPVPAPAAPAPRPRPKALLIAVPLVLLLVIGIGAIVFLMTRGAVPADRARLETRGAFPERPEAGWRIGVREVAPPAFEDPEFGVGMTYVRRSAVIDLGDTVVVSVAGEYDDRPVLVGLDTATGKTRWRTAGDAQRCATRTVDGMLPCAVPSDDDEQPRAVTLIRISDGTVQQVPTKGRVQYLEVVDGDLITVQSATAAGGDGMTVTRGTITAPTSGWSVTPNIARSCWGTGDSQYFGADRDFVHYGNDAGQVLLRSDTGAPAFGKQLKLLQVRTGRGALGQTCADDTSNSPRTQYVLDSDGDALHSAPAGQSAPMGMDGSARTDAPYLVGADAHDFGTGTRLWSLPGTGGDPERAQLIGDVLLTPTACVSAPCPQTVSGFSVDSGELLWTGGEAELGYGSTPGGQWITDGTRLISVRDDAVTALDLGSGHTTWTLPAGSGASLYPVGDGFVVETGTTLTYYPPS